MYSDMKGFVHLKKVYLYIALKSSAWLIHNIVKIYSDRNSNKDYYLVSYSFVCELLTILWNDLLGQTFHSRQFGSSFATFITKGCKTNSIEYFLYFFFLEVIFIKGGFGWGRLQKKKKMEYQPSGAGGTRLPPATPHRVPVGPKMANGVWKGVYP